MVFAGIKDANAVVDESKNYPVDSKEYNECMDALGLILDPILVAQGRLKFALNLSSRTGHYWIKIF
jgi:hypothetical protein